MDTEANITALEQRYQVLLSDFQAGKIDQSAFMAEVDRLQFQDRWGRYWMIGAQTGNWHYYDGQQWHQADPRQADNLPFVDDQGRYWQQGVKSGDWYYYQPDTGEWVKPGRDDEPAPPQYGAQPAQAGQGASVPYSSRLQPQQAQAGPDMSQLDAELYQDDEGRYWAIGRKTGQWYFYEHDGWHPAHEFQPAAASQPYTGGPAGYDTGAYQPQQSQQPQQPAQPFDSQPQQPVYPPGGGQPAQPAQAYVVQPQYPPYQQPASPTQPIQIYITSPGQEQRQQPQPAPPVRPEPPAAAEEPAPPPAQPEPQAPPPAPAPKQEAGPEPPQMPNPPRDRSESGSWYYFDGRQWLKYATGEPEETPPPPPTMVIEQEAKPTAAAPAPKPKEEPVVAEFFEDDEPPVEVVDVEVITVIEPEPEPEPRRPAPVPEPEPEPRPAAADDEVRPRRPGSRPVEVPRRARREPALPDQPRPERRERKPSEPERPVLPRKRETAAEPTIIIPTGATASSISSPAVPPKGRGQPSRPASPERQRRARENTVPMDAIKEGRSAAPTGVHRQMTQPLPRATARPDTAPVPAQPPRQTAAQAAGTQAKPEKTGYTVGDILRAFPSTLWTIIGGVVLLLACAVGLIFTWSWLQGEDLAPSPGLVAVPNVTPTLDAGPPDTTPTPGPTPTSAPESAVESTPAALTGFSSADLGISLEYPENWEYDEDSLCSIFSPSTDGLNRKSPKDAALWICKSDETGAAIPDLLTGVLSGFPTDAETLNEGTISIASQTWTSAQIRYEDENLGGQGIATLAVTSKEGAGYSLVAVAPADRWNAVQPLFQSMINSFSFSVQAVAGAGTPEATLTTGTATAEAETDATPEKTVEATPATKAKPKETATPLVYVVQSGDTLLGIANQFGVDVDLLAAKNGIDEPESLQIGQELIIPFTDEELEQFNSEGGTETETAPAPAKEEPGPAGEQAAASEPEPAPAPAEAPASEAAPVSGRIVYPAFNPGTNVYDVWMVDLASGAQSLIAGEASQPAFNKDGSLLAYRSWGLGTRGIFFRDFVGGRGGQVTRFVEDGLPTWSPDGFTFAFATRREGDRVSRIYIGNQLGDEAYSIGFQGEYPSTFPDGRLVVKGCSLQGECGLYVMGGTGGGEQKISGEVSDTAPAVSPDGTKIAFMSSARGATNWEIWVMNADGSDPKRLTENGSNEGLPAWSPDGRSIAYVSDQGGVWAVWVMNADGSNQRKLFNMNGSPDGEVLRDTDNSRGWLEERISWAP